MQFLSTVVSSEAILEKYSFESQTSQEVIEFTLTNELQATAKLGSYSGV